MIVQFYTMQTPEEALAVIEAGADHIGLTPSVRGLPGEIDIPTTQAIMQATVGKAVRVALTVETTLPPIVTMVEAVRPDVLHLCPLTGTFGPEDVAELRLHFPGLPIMQAISVAGRDAIMEAKAYESLCEYLILDTQAPDIAGIGASGKTHDWSISRAIVEAVRVPVILAGGLSPDNVVDAIQAVRPWGVDSLTHTNQPLAAGGFRKDIAKVRAFAQAAKAAGIN
jgi:phosphoribosylanthranilate isomerase